MDQIEQRRLANLMGMAGTAETAKNYDEALSYYNRVLEEDPTFSDAWLGKGRAAGWLSTIKTVRLTESIVACGHAIATAPEVQKAAVAAQAASDVNEIAVALFNLGRKHHTEFPSVPAARETYATCSAQVIDALVSLQNLAPTDPLILKNIVVISGEALNIGLNEPLKTKLQTIRSDAIIKLAVIDPAYEAAPLASQTLAQKEASAAESDNMGKIVLFLVSLVVIVIAVLTRA